MILERMTPTERKICRLVQDGRRTREIAQALTMSAFMVRKRMVGIFDKAGVESRLQLANVLTIEALADPVVRCQFVLRTLITLGWNGLEGRK